MEHCWNQVGVGGDRSCPELSAVTHCRNCPVYATAGRELLEREAPDGYVTEWTSLLATQQNGVTQQSRQLNGALLLEQTQIQTVDLLSVVIFRLKSEWLALPAELFMEVTPMASIHTLPHRSNQILLGLVNIRGELQLCISLANLLGLEANHAVTRNLNPVAYQRLVVMAKAGDRWVFPVDEIYGVQRFRPEDLRPVPTSVTKSTTYTKGLLHWREAHVNYLDDELLFHTLNRQVLG